MYRLLIFILFVLCSCANQQKQIQHPLNWEYNINTAIIKAEKSHKLVLLYFYGENCDWCEAMNASLNDKSIRKLLDKKFILAWIDVEKSELAKFVKIKTVPTVVVVYPNKNDDEIIGSEIGYLNIPEFKQFLKQNIKKSNNLKGELHL